MPNAKNDQLAEITSPLSFNATRDRITQAIESAGLTIFAQIDHAQGARAIGIAMPPTLVLIYGHARGGTPLMHAVPRVALDLPLRVLLRETDDGHVVIAFHPIAPMLRQAGVPESLAARLEPAQQLLEGAIA
ncbi:MAG: DUF302 domain-containing protein [Rhodanobacter sp.]